MRTRTWAIVITVNVIASAAVMLSILLLWNRTQDSATPTPMSRPPITQEAASPPHVPHAPSPTPPAPQLH